MDYSEDEEELQSEYMSPSESGPQEPIAGKRDRLRAVLLPAIHSRVTALGGFEDMVVRKVEDEGSKDGNAAEVVEETFKAYKLGDECLGCLKDLKRFWRMDDNDDDRNVARMFYETGLLKSDLIPILNGAGQADASTRQEKAALASADLIAAMTWPINVIDELRDAELSGDKAAVAAINKVDYSSLITAQRNYKSSLLKSGAIKTLFRILVPRLEKGLRDRTQRDENIISLILHIWRNLAAIRDRAFSTYHSAESLEEASLQSELIAQLASENVFDLLITISSLSNKTEFNQWNMVCLEIFYLLFRGVAKPEVLIKKSEGVTKVIRDEQLGKLLNDEASKRRLETRKGVTRHSRFGTTVVIENGKDRIVMHKQAAVVAAAINPGKIMDQNRKTKKLKVRTENDLAPPAELSPEAIKVLQIVAMSFLESAFNPFFGSVLKDIRMERAKVREMDNIRLLFLVRFFLEYFLGLYAYERSIGLDAKSEDAHDFDLIAEMTDPNSIAYVGKRMSQSLEEKPPLWTELHATTECFVQLLLVMDALQHSDNEEYREVSDILQNKLYYNRESLDMILGVLKVYKLQPIKFLDSIIHLSYVLLRMLEKYSKSKDYMYIKKKAARRKSKQASGDLEGEGQDDEEGDLEAARGNHQEHQFRFDDFESNFADNSCIATLLTYLAGYKTFTEEDQMKRVVNLLHRVAVRVKSEGYFFKATTLELFRRLLDDKSYLPKSSANKDLYKLITYISKQFFKAAKEYPLLLIDVFFPSRGGKVNSIIAHQDSYDDDEQPKVLKLPAELEIKNSERLDHSRQIGIGVALLSDKNRDDLLTWVKDTMSFLAKERRAAMSAVDADKLLEMQQQQATEEDQEALSRQQILTMTSGPSEDAIASLSDYDIPYLDDDIKQECRNNLELKLLLRSIKWESRDSDDLTHLVWSIPAWQLPEDLFGSIKTIDDYLINPLDLDDGQVISNLVRKKYNRKPTKRTRLSVQSGSEDEDDIIFSDPEAAAAINGTRGKKSKKAGNSRKRREHLAEGDVDRSRKLKRAEEAKIYRTAPTVEDSDDDSENDRAFFEREAELRRNMELKAGKGNGIVEKSRGNTQKKGMDKAKAKNKKRASFGGWDNEENANMGVSGSESSSSTPAKIPLAIAKARPRAIPAMRQKSTQVSADLSSSPNQSSSSNPLKRSRAATSDLEESDIDVKIERQSNSIAGAFIGQDSGRRGRLVVESDDDE